MSRSDLQPIEDRVYNALKEHFQGNAPKFIIGVSGGPDSMCLLYLFQKMKVDAVVVHINYAKRGMESDKDAELVEQMAFQWGYDCHSLKIDPDESMSENFQQWARDVRYEAFRKLVEEYNATGIAVAHNQDDQVETILQKQFRGAGLASWSAMSVWDGNIFRPLLHTTREEIETYIQQKSIPYRTDASNLKSEFARNFLRNKWLEELGQHFPGWRKNVLRIAGQAALFEESIEWIAGQITDEKKRISREKLLDLGAGLRKAVILLLLKTRQPDIQISGSALDELDHLPDLQTGKSIQLTNNLALIRDRDHFSITVHEGPSQFPPVELRQQQLEAGPLELSGVTIEIVKCTDPDFNQHLYLDVDKIQWPVKVRLWQKGDRFQPFGMEGHQNISDHLTNRKISAAEKNKALVVESFEETICAVIFPPTENRVPPGTISALVQCEESTRRCLTIKRRV